MTRLGRLRMTAMVPRTDSTRRACRRSRNVIRAISTAAYICAFAQAQATTPPTAFADAQREASQPSPRAALAFDLPVFDLPTDGAFPLTVLVDRFETGQVDDRRWIRFTSTNGPRADTGGGVLLAASDKEDLRPRELSSVVIDLSAMVAASVSIRCRAEPARDVPNLRIDYSTPDESWRTLADISARDLRDSEVLALRLLPLEGLHSAARIRIRCDCSLPRHGWRILEARIDALPQSAVRKLRIATQPQLDAPLEALTAGHLADRTLPGSGEVMIEPGDAATVVAPAYWGGQRFDSWAVDGRTIEPVSRWMQIAAAGDFSLVASFVPGNEADGVGLRVHSMPIDSVPIDVAPGPSSLGVRLVCPRDITVLPGESLTLRAPSRVPGAVFWRWRVNSRIMPEGLADVLIRCDAPMHCVAEYALRGDMNGDERLDRQDVEVFLHALVDPDDYALRFPGLDRAARGDMNADGAFDDQDIDPFVDRLTGP